MELESETTDFGEMRGGSIFCCKSRSGFPLDLLKSGIQKYVRRGELNKSLFCCSEMELFTKIGCKGVVTNLLNRLKVILVEDICWNEVGNICSIIDLIDEYEKSERTKNQCLFRCLYIMKECKKLRYASDIKSVFTIGVRLELIKINKNIERENIIGVNNDDKSILENMGKFIKCYREKNEEKKRFHIKVQEKE